MNEEQKEHINTRCPHKLRIGTKRGPGRRRRRGRREKCGFENRVLTLALMVNPDSGLAPVVCGGCRNVYYIKIQDAE